MTNLEWGCAVSNHNDPSRPSEPSGVTTERENEAAERLYTLDELMGPWDGVTERPADEDDREMDR